MHVAKGEPVGLAGARGHVGVEARQRPVVVWGANKRRFGGGEGISEAGWKLVKGVGEGLVGEYEGWDRLCGGSVERVVGRLREMVE